MKTYKMKNKRAQWKRMTRARWRKRFFPSRWRHRFHQFYRLLYKTKKLTRTHTPFLYQSVSCDARAAVFQLLWSLFIEIFTCSISCCTDVNSLNTHCRELYEFMWNDKVKWRYKKQYCHLWYDEWVNVRLILQLATESCKILQNMNDNQMS